MVHPGIMDVMVKSRTDKARLRRESDSRRLGRLQFELQLELSDTDKRSVEERLRWAADKAESDLLFVLPAPDGTGTTAVIRFKGEGEDRLLQIRATDAGFDFTEEADIDPVIRGFARSSIDVLERLKADKKIPEPAAPATH